MPKITILRYPKSISRYLVLYHDTISIYFTVLMCACTVRF